MAAATLTGFLSRRAEAAGADTAIVYEGDALGFAALDDRARRAAAGLAELGVGPGDRVAVWLPNVPAWFDLLFACARLGAIAVAVNTRFRASEVADIVGRSGANVLALWPGFKQIDFLGILAEVEPAALPALEALVLYGEGEGEGEAAPAIAGDGRRTVRHDELLAAAPHRDDRAAPGTGCAIFTTSGTTKAPKFVLHSQEGLVRHAEEVSRAFGYGAPDAAMLQGLPLCGVFGLCQAMASLAAARPMVLMPSFDGALAAAHIRSHRITHMNGTDEMYRRMLDARSEPRPFPSLRHCGFAAFNADPHEVVAEGDRRGIPYVGLYGMSEVQALYAAQPVDADAGRRALGGGVPVSPEARVRVRDPESGRLLPDGEQGELELAGPSRMVGYFRDAEATAAALTEDGYVRSGDLGYTVPGGFVFVTRMGDALRLGGFLVSPLEISSCLEDHPAVAACQVVGVEQRTEGGAQGTRAVAFVIPAAGQTCSEQGLREYCAARMAKFKVPARILEIDAFPVTQSANGVKIQRGKLRAAAVARLNGENG